MVPLNSFSTTTGNDGSHSSVVLGGSGRVINSLKWLLPSTAQVPWLFLLLVHTSFTITMEGSDADFEAYSQRVWQQASTSCSCYMMPQNASLVLSPCTCDLLVSVIYYPLSPFPCNSCKRNSSSICTALQFYVQLPLLYTVWSNAYSKIGLEEVAATTLHDFLNERL